MTEPKPRLSDLNLALWRERAERAEAERDEAVELLREHVGEDMDYFTWSDRVHAFLARLRDRST